MRSWTGDGHPRGSARLLRPIGPGVFSPRLVQASVFVSLSVPFVSLSPSFNHLSFARGQLALPPSLC